MKRIIQQFFLLMLLAIAGTVLAADALTDDQIREQIVQESIQAYPSNCPCPFNSDRAGRRCGGRSAWSRPGGHSPICYTKEISDDQVHRYRAKHGISKP